MQSFIDLIVNNLAFFIGLLVFVIFTIGLVIALLTPSGRETLGRAAVRFAIAALKAAETWMGRQITGEKLDAINARQVAPQHPIITAQVNLQSWLDGQR